MILAARFGVFLAILGVWSLTAASMPAGLFATPIETLHAAQTIVFEGRFWSALAQSLQVYALGLACAVCFGMGAGILMGLWAPLRQTLDPFVNALAATPRVAFVPLVIVLLGLGVSAKVFIVFLGAVMPILLNTIAGVRNANPHLIEMARSYGRSPLQILRGVILPGAVPFLLTGLRVGATIGLINTVVAELYTAVSGLGGLLSIYGGSFRMAEYFVIVVSLSVIGCSVTEALRILETRLTRWTRAGR